MKSPQIFFDFNEVAWKVFFYAFWLVHSSEKLKQKVIYIKLIQVNWKMLVGQIVQALNSC